MNRKLTQAELETALKDLPPVLLPQEAAALLRLARDPGLREMLGRNAERRVRAEFDHHGSIAFLMALFEGRRAAA